MVCEGSRRSSIRGDARISQSHSEYSINFSFNFVAQMSQRRCDRLCLWNHCLNYKTQKRKTSDVFQKLQGNRGRMITVPILRNSNSFSKRIYISEVDDCLVKQRWFMLPSTFSMNHWPSAYSNETKLWGFQLLKCYFLFCKKYHWPFQRQRVNKFIKEPFSFVQPSFPHKIWKLTATVVYQSKN